MENAPRSPSSHQPQGGKNTSIDPTMPTLPPPATPTASVVNTSTMVDAISSFHWSNNLPGPRRLFRPVYQSNYKDAEDYYRKAYDAGAGLRVAVSLGGLMLFICIIGLNNRYRFFRKRRKLHTSVGNSQEQLEGIEWLRLMGWQSEAAAAAAAAAQDFLEYNPACSDQDLLRTMSTAAAFQPASSRVLCPPDSVVVVDEDATQAGQSDVNSRLVASVEAISTAVPLHYSENKFLRCNSF